MTSEAQPQTNHFKGRHNHGRHGKHGKGKPGLNLIVIVIVIFLHPREREIRIKRGLPQAEPGAMKRAPRFRCVSCSRIRLLIVPPLSVYSEYSAVHYQYRILEASTVLNRYRIAPTYRANSALTARTRAAASLGVPMVIRR